MRRKRGFNLIELMVVVAIIAILASVALPMYSTFKRKSKAATAVKCGSQAFSALQGWWQFQNSFSGLELSGRIFIQGSDRIGVSLGQLENCTFEVVGTPDRNRLVVEWVFHAGCNNCGGQICLLCQEDYCSTEVKLNESNLGLNRRSDVGVNACGT